MIKVFKSDPEDKKVKRLYHQRYRTEWEKIPEFSGWLRPSNDGYSAHCVICDANVLARLASIKQHLITRKHQTVVKSELSKDENNPGLLASITTLKPKAKPKPKHKLKSKMQPKMKHELKEERMEDDEIASNDSILDDLLRTEPLAQEYVVENELVEEHDHQDIHEQEAYEEDMIHIKQDEPDLQDFQDDDISEDAIISEFDLFGKSLALQLNNMDLEDALLCQERLQVVLTEFRLKILKRKRENKRSS